MRLHDVTESLARFGLLRTLADLGLRAINRAVLFHVILAIALERASPELEAGEPLDPDYRFGPLDEPTLLRFIGDPGYELTAPFLRDAFARGDECFGFMRGGELASYAWYTRLPTPVGLPGVALRFGPGWVHIYKGLTHPAHRGRRLHGRGMAQALALHLARGARGLVTYVDLTSFGARRSVARVGFTTFGALVLTRLFARYRVWTSPECTRRGFQLEFGRPGVGTDPQRTRPLPGAPNA